MAYSNVTQEMAILQAGPPPTWGFENYLDGEPNMGFFAKAPLNIPAYFSTANGRRARPFTNEFVGNRRIFPWNARQIQRAADAIKNECWEIRKFMQKPTSYFELFYYWDAYDLWHIGVQNAWNVLNHMYLETQQAVPQLVQGALSILDEWAREFLSDKARRSKLFSWDPTDPTAVHDVLRDVFDPEELEDLNGLDMWYIPIAQDIMLRARVAFRNGTYPLHKPIPTASLSNPNGQADRTNNRNRSTAHPTPSLSVADKIRAMEKAVMQVIDEPPIQTGDKIVNKICIADGTSATAVKTSKHNAIKNGADAESGTSLNADKLLKAVSATDDNSSWTSSHTSGAEKQLKVDTKPVDTQPSTAVIVDEKAQPESLDDKQTLQELIAGSFQNNREKAYEEYYVTGKSSASEGDAASDLILLEEEVRCASAPIFDLTWEEGEARSHPGNEYPEEKTCSCQNPFRPEPNGEVFEDLPPTLEKYPDNLDQGHPDNAPRKAPTGSIDGPERGRLDAVPNPTPLLTVLHQMYPDVVIQEPASGEEFAGHAETRAHISSFYQDPTDFQQLSGPQRYPSNAPWMNGPQFATGFQMHQFFPSGGPPWRRFGGLPSEAPGAQSSPPPTPLFYSPPSSRRISDLRGEDMSSSWRQQTTSDSIHGPVLRHSPPRNQSYGSQSQSSYLNNGNSIGREGRKRSTEHRHNSGSSNSYSQLPHEFGYNGNGYGLPSNPPFANRRFSSSGGDPPFDGHRMNNAGHHHPNAAIRNHTHNSRDRRDTAFNHRSLSIKPDCKNYEQRLSSESPAHKVYLPCSCEHCKIKDRTVFIGGFRQCELAFDHVIKALKTIFAQFGFIRSHRVVAQGKSIELEYASVESVMEAIREMNGKIINLCQYPIRVTHPFGSQYFQPWQLQRDPGNSNHNQRHFSSHSGASSMYTSYEKADTSNNPKRKSVQPMDRRQPHLAAPHTRVPSVNDLLFDPNFSQDVGLLTEDWDTAVAAELPLQSPDPTCPEMEKVPDSMKEENQTLDRDGRSFEKQGSEQSQKSLPGKHPILDAESNYAVSDEDDSAGNTEAFPSKEMLNTLDGVPETQKASYASAARGSSRLPRVKLPGPKRDITSSPSKISTESTSNEIIRKIGEVCASTSRHSSRSVTPTKRHGCYRAKSQTSTLRLPSPTGHRQHSKEQKDRNSSLKHMRSSNEISAGGEQFDLGTVIHRPNKAKYHNTLPTPWTQASTHVVDHVQTNNSEPRDNITLAGEGTSHDSYTQISSSRSKKSQSKKKKKNARGRSTSRQQSTEHVPALRGHDPTVDDPDLPPPGP